jgi:hypothetical protein
LVCFQQRSKDKHELFIFISGRAIKEAGMSDHCMGKTRDQKAKMIDWYTVLFTANTFTLP